MIRSTYIRKARAFTLRQAWSHCISFMVFCYCFVYTGCQHLHGTGTKIQDLCMTVKDELITESSFMKFHPSSATKLLSFAKNSNALLRYLLSVIIQYFKAKVWCGAMTSFMIFLQNTEEVLGFLRNFLMGGFLSQTKFFSWRKKKSKLLKKNLFFFMNYSVI